MAQEKLGRRLADAFRQLEWEASVTRRGLGGGRVEVRHPLAQRDGTKWLVATVSLEELPEDTRPRPRVTYAVPMYRAAIEHTVASVVSKSARGAPKRRAKGGVR